MTTSTTSNADTTSNNNKGILETIDDQLHAAVLPLEGKDYETWKGKHYPDEKEADKTQGVLNTAKEQIVKTKDQIGAVFTETKEHKDEPPEEKDVTQHVKELTEQAQQMAAETTNELVKVGDKVDDQLHAVALPLEGKDYDAWKESKEAQRQKDNEAEEGEKDFIGKATTQIKTLFGGETKDDSHKSAS